MKTDDFILRQVLKGAGQELRTSGMNDPMQEAEAALSQGHCQCNVVARCVLTLRLANSDI